VRGARPDDLPRIVDIERQSFKHPYSPRLMASLMALAGDLFVVYEVGGEVIGYAVALLREGRLGHIMSIAVDPGHRRRGVGTALLSELLRRLKEKGALVARLEVRVSNEAALRLYRKLGFKEIYVMPDYYPDGEACYVMVKWL